MQVDPDLQTTETRRELARLRIIAGKVSSRALLLNDTELTDLASQMFTGFARILRAAQNADNPLPTMSEEGAGLSVPLELLNTSANRRLLAVLEDAHAAALAVDRERGYGEDGPAQDLADWVCTVREEIHGPESGRE